MSRVTNRVIDIFVSVSTLIRIKRISIRGLNCHQVEATAYWKHRYFAKKLGRKRQTTGSGGDLCTQQAIQFFEGVPKKEKDPKVMYVRLETVKMNK